MPKTKDKKLFDAAAEKRGYIGGDAMADFFSVNKEGMRDIYKKHRTDKDPLPDELDRRLEKRDPKALADMQKVTRKEYADEREKYRIKSSRRPAPTSSINATKKAKGGSVSKRADGIATKGKTKGRFV